MTSALHNPNICIRFQDLCKQNLGEEGYRYFPFALGLFTTIGFCNVTNLLPYIEMPTQVRFQVCCLLLKLTLRTVNIYDK